MNYSNLYNNLTNIYGKFSSFLPFGLALPPIRATIELTYNCNLHCKMCYQQSQRGKGNQRIEMTKGEIKKIIDKMPPKTLITLTGGEPLIRKDALEIIEYAGRRHNCNIITNGTLIDQEKARRLVEKNLTLIGVSIDGIGKNHDKIRRVEGAFKKAITGIQLIQKEKAKLGLKFPLIDIKTVILPENLSQLHQIYNLARELKVDFFTISILRSWATLLSPPVSKTAPEFAYRVSPKVDGDFDVNLLEEQLKMITSEESPVKLRFYPRELNWHLRDYYANKISPRDYLPCIFPWTSFFISPLGDVFPCLTLGVGNIKKQNLFKIWNGKKMRQFRLRLKKARVFFVCQGCCNLCLKKYGESDF